MRNIWIARHAERFDSIDHSWKTYTRFPDDTPLSLNGHKQAKALGDKMINEDIEHVICSPFLRARQTAAMIAKKINKKIIVKIELHEYIDIGRTEIEWGSKVFEYESRSKMMSRMQEVINDLLKLKGNIILVSHGSPTSGLINACTGKFPEQMLGIAEVVKIPIE